LLAANKRIANLLKKSATGETAGHVQPAVDAKLLALPAEQQLNRSIDEAERIVPTLTAKGSYNEALGKLARLRPAVDQFFDDVMVMDPNPELRANRLALLTRLRALFSGIAVF
jgi:glycyl-tRNA synthetase beta chain